MPREGTTTHTRLLIALSLAALALVAGAASGALAAWPIYSSPVWSHDGKRIALVGRVASGAQFLAVMNADGSGLRRLDAGTSYLGWPTWSPDDRLIAFAAGRMSPAGTELGISIIRSEGGGLRRIVERGWAPEWSPGGRKIAYASGDDTDAHWIYVVNPDGTGRRLATRPTYVESYENPSWSGDGDRLVFSVGQVPDGGGGAPGLGFIGDYGGRVTYLLRDRSPDEPDWSPARAEIVFTDRDEGSHRISVLDLKTRGVKRLRLGWNPAWSPDGDRIVFVRGGSLYLMNRHGSGVRALLMRG